MDTDGVEERGTQTHYSEDGARESVLVAVDSDAVGRDNTYPPPNPYDGALGVSMRRGYFIHGYDVVVQFPRRSDEYEAIDEKLELEDIRWSPGVVHAYYPINKTKAVCISWRYAVDEWEMNEEEFESGYVDEIDSTHARTIWKNRHGL